MTLHEKITHIRKTKKISRAALHRKIVEKYGKNAISYRTIKRIEEGSTSGRVSSTHQICSGLDIRPQELFKDIEIETKPLKKGQNYARYLGYPGVKIEILSKPEEDAILLLKLTLEPNGQTKPEQDPAREIKYRKIIYVLSGKVKCLINNIEYILRKDESYTFDSTQEHYFINNSASKTRFLLIQNPKRL